MALGFQSSQFSQPPKTKKAAHTHRDCAAFYFFTFLPFYFFTFLLFYLLNGVAFYFFTFLLFYL